MSAAVSPLTAHLGYWLRQVSNHVSHAFARELAALDVTVAEWVLLRVLSGEAPTPPSHLAERMGVTRGAVTKLADRLLAKGLVVRVANPDDGRAQTLALTATGAALVPTLAAVADQNDAVCFAHLSDDDRRVLRRLLEDTVTTLGITAPPVD